MARFLSAFLGRSVKPILLILSLLPATAYADCSQDGVCERDFGWYDFSKFVVTYQSNSDGPSSTFTYTYGASELSITAQTGEDVVRFLSIKGVAALYAGLEETGVMSVRECAPHTIDIFPILQAYAIRPIYLINLSSEMRPDKLSGKKDLSYEQDHDSGKVRINPSDSMTFGAPWSVSGYIQKNEEITYELIHRQTIDGNQVDTLMSGSWSSEANKLDVADSEKLDDWLVCLRGSTAHDGGELPAKPQITDPSNLKTVGRLRAYAVED